VDRDLTLGGASAGLSDLAWRDVWRLSGLAWASLLAVAACGGETGSGSRGAQASAPPAAVPLLTAGNPSFAPDGRLLAISGKRYSCALFVGEVREQGDVVPVRHLPGCTEGAAVSPSGREVAQIRAGDRRFRFAVRRIADGKPRFETAVSATHLDALRAYWSPDGRRVLGEFGGRNTVFNAVSGRRIRTIDAGYLGRQPFSPDGRRVVIADKRGALLITVTSGRRRLVRVPGGLQRPSWSPNGSAIAGFTAAGVAWVDLSTGATRSAAANGVLEVAWSPDGRQIAAYGTGLSGERWFVSVIDAASGAVTEVHRFEEGAEQGELAWSADATRVAFVVSA
jgi:Tol biopolymer transport system component